jgi:hypothetical protein
MVVTTPDRGVNGDSPASGSKDGSAKREAAVNGSSNHRRKGDGNDANTTPARTGKNDSLKSPSSAEVARGAATVNSGQNLSPEAAAQGTGPLSLASPPRKRHSRPFIQTLPIHNAYPRMQPHVLINGWELPPAVELRLTADLEALYQTLLPAGDNISRRHQVRR